MNRRRYLAALAATGTTLSGCTGIPSGSGESDESVAEALNIQSEQLRGLDEWTEYDSARVKTTQLAAADSVEYNNPSEGNIKTWNPGEDRQIIVVQLWAENLSDEKKSFPHWDNFQLATADEELDPTPETPDGTSVTEIEAEKSSMTVSWPRSSGLRRNYERGWSAVYDAPKTGEDVHAVKWNAPSDNAVYWAETN